MGLAKLTGLAILLTFVSCARPSPKHAQPALILVKPAAVVYGPPEPIKTGFRILYVREYGDFFVTDTEDCHLTLEEAVAKGFTEELWIYALMHTPKGSLLIVYLVKPCRA